MTITNQENKNFNIGFLLIIVGALLVILGMCSGCTDSPEDLNGYDCVLIVSGKSDECMVIKSVHTEVYAQCNYQFLQVDYFTFPKGSNGFNAFKNYSQGDTLQ